MNDGVSSHSGIPRSAFPDNVPTFSGHFHKPHTVGGRDGFIRYVGSPYQVRHVPSYVRVYQWISSPLLWLVLVRLWWWL